MEKKKIIKWIWGALAVGLLTFATIKSCKNNDFSAFKTLTSEKSLPTRAERINAPKRAKTYSWDNINSWNDLNGITLTYKGVASGGTQTAINIYSQGTNRVLIHNGNVIYTISTSANQSLGLYYDSGNQIIRYVGRTESGSIGSTTLTVGDTIIFYANTELTTWNSTIKSILMNSFDLPIPISATLELDLTNLTNFDLSAIYLDNNEFPLSSNMIDLTTLSDGEHTLTFYDAQNDNCFNSSIQTIYSGWGSSLFQPLSSTTFSNNSDYRGQMVFTWDSSLLSENKVYKITLSGQASYNFNFLTGKSYILNAELPYLKQQGERWWLDAKDTETTYFVYNYSNSSLAVKAVARTEGVDAIHGNYLIFGNNQDSSLIFGEYPIYAHQINAYENEYGVPPRLISFLSTFNNDNMNNLFYSYNGAVANIVGDYMYSANIVDYIVANSFELTNDQIETYQSGYDTGYQEGLRYSSSLSNLIYNFFKGIDDALSIEIIPNVQVKYIIYIPLVLSIVRFILGWFK